MGLFGSAVDALTSPVRGALGAAKSGYEWLGKTEHPGQDKAAEDDLQRMLMARAHGGQSVAGLQAQQMMQQGQAAGMAQAASVRPDQGAMATRMAIQNSGNVAATINQQAMAARLAEQQANQEALAQWLLQRRQLAQGDVPNWQKALGAASGVATTYGGMKG